MIFLAISDAVSWSGGFRNLDHKPNLEKMFSVHENIATEITVIHDQLMVSEFVFFLTQIELKN